MRRQLRRPPTYCAFITLAAMLLLPAALMAQASLRPDVAKGAGAPAAPAGGAALTAEVNINKLSDQLKQGELWLTVFYAWLFGALGALIHELVPPSVPPSPPIPGAPIPVPAPRASAAAGVPAPPPPGAVARPVLDPWFIARVLAGGLASVAVLYFIAPVDALQMIALSIIVGAAGMVLFQAMQARVEALLKTRQLAAANGQVAAAAQFHQEILDQTEALKRKLQTGAAGVAAAVGQDVVVAALDQISGLAARGLRATGGAG